MALKRFWYIAIVIVLLDQIIKAVVRTFMVPGERISVISDWLQVRYVQNTGIAFGLFRDSGSRWVFAAFSVIIIVVILLCEKKIRKNSADCACGFIIGGSIGNALDRLFFGFVTDYVDFHPWPAYNLADVALTFGTVLFIVWLVCGQENKNR